MHKWSKVKLNLLFPDLYDWVVSGVSVVIEVFEKKECDEHIKLNLKEYSLQHKYSEKEKI